MVHMISKHMEPFRLWSVPSCQSALLWDVLCLNTDLVFGTKLPHPPFRHVNLIECPSVPAGKFSGTVAPNWGPSLSDGLKDDGTVHMGASKIVFSEQHTSGRYWYDSWFLAWHGQSVHFLRPQKTAQNFQSTTDCALLLVRSDCVPHKSSSFHQLQRCSFRENRGLMKRRITQRPRPDYFSQHHIHMTGIEEHAMSNDDHIQRRQWTHEQ